MFDIFFRKRYNSIRKPLLNANLSDQRFLNCVKGDVAIGRRSDEGKALVFDMAVHTAYAYKHNFPADVQYL